jgi:hypothetical protein
MLTPNLATISGFSPESRVWVYTANRPLNDTEVQATQQALDQFVLQWTAHNAALKAVAEVFQNQFVLLMVDESQAGASGCSIDKSVHFLESLSRQLNIDLFERMRFAWVQDDALQFANRPEFSALVQNARITNNTLVVNTLVENKQDLKENWLVPFEKSWHRRLV